MTNCSPYALQRRMCWSHVSPTWWYWTTYTHCQHTRTVSM